jgi:hypothetical protein
VKVRSAFGVHIRPEDHKQGFDTDMLKGIRALLRKTPRDNPAKKPARKTPAKPATAGKDFRAVSIAPGSASCAAANAIAGKRYLFREVPHLPLVDCTMAPNCSCKFKKVSDRRDRDRRQINPAEPTRRFAGPDNRKNGRRSVAKA